MHVDNILAGAIILVLHIIPFTPWIDAWCIRSGEHAADPEGQGESRPSWAQESSLADAIERPDVGAARHRPCGGALDEGHCICQV
jgi:hypothetical protein